MNQNNNNQHIAKGQKKKRARDVRRARRQREKLKKKRKKNELMNLSLDLEIQKKKTALRQEQFIEERYDQAARMSRMDEMERFIGFQPSWQGYGPVKSPHGIHANGFGPVISRGFTSGNQLHGGLYDNTGTRVQNGMRQVQSTSSYASRNFHSPNGYLEVETKSRLEQNEVWRSEDSGVTIETPKNPFAGKYIYTQMYV